VETRYYNGFMRIPDEDLSTIVRAAYAYRDTNITRPLVGLHSLEPHFEDFPDPNEFGRWLLKATGDWVTSTEVETYGEKIWKQYDDPSWIFNTEVNIAPTPVHLMLILSAYVKSMHPMIGFRLDQREWAFQFMMILADETVELIEAENSRLVIPGK
jgi:hypothetical protein